ncbi:MAG: hypothetical protein IJW71_05665 [Clostridia bacterium]|nr:hypothetical protein [Clostridia bacterium]
MFTISEPTEGERVTLLHPYHLAYVANPIKSGVGAVYLLNLHASGAALSACGDNVNDAAVGYLHAARVTDRTLSRIRDILLA